MTLVSRGFVVVVGSDWLYRNFDLISYFTREVRSSGRQLFCSGSATSPFRNGSGDGKSLAKICLRLDSNQYFSRNYPLKIACLPLSPHRHRRERDSNPWWVFFPHTSIANWGLKPTQPPLQREPLSDVLSQNRPPPRQGEASGPARFALVRYMRWLDSD